MKVIDVFRALFEMPATPINSVKLRCVTHARTFSESLDANFHETMNLGCRWERLRVDHDKMRPLG